MDERFRKVIALLLLYAVVFAIGYKTGEAVQRSKNRIQFEKIFITKDVIAEQ